MVKIGLVGKPSVGKSTFFKASTLMNVDIANYPFTTIDPNSGFGHVMVRDAAVDFGKTSNPRTGFVRGEKRYVPFEIIDVAGLVPGAHEGRGRGLAFLSDLNEADALIHVVDVSGSVNADGEDVKPGSYDPTKDVQFLTDELDHWYHGILKKGWEKLARKTQQEAANPIKTIYDQVSGLRVSEDDVKASIKNLELPEKLTDWTQEQLFEFAQDLRKKSKPMVIAANKIDRPTSKENLQKLKETFPELIIIPCSAEIELALREADKAGSIRYDPGASDFEILDESQLTEKQKGALEYVKQFLKEYGNTGVQQTINKAVFDLLEYVAIFPGGSKKLEDSEGRTLPDCFLMPPGTTPYDFAGALHTDFQKHFIRANDVRKKMPVAKDEPLKHGDVIEIVSGK